MFTELFKNSPAIELVNESTDESGVVNLLFRILDKKRWDKLMVAALKSQYESEEFGVSIRKEYYLAEDEAGDRTPKFSWAMMLWGDLEAAGEALGPMVMKRVGPPPPPASVNTVSTSGLKTLQKTVTFNDKKEKMIRVKAPLPHRAPERNGRSRDEVGKGATAELMGFSESRGPSSNYSEEA